MEFPSWRLCSFSQRPGLPLEYPNENREALQDGIGTMNLSSGKPRWLKAKLPGGELYDETRRAVQDNRLHTVCQEAQCPNLGECWSRGTATIMILGDVCTRACGFCAVKNGRPTELDLDEPERTANAVALMKLKHVVITSVARDELKDGGAAVWAETVAAVRRRNPKTRIEILVPDFLGNRESWKLVFDSKPDIFNHNTETVPRLAPKVRSVARWDRTLEILRAAKAVGLVTKSGLMLGLGERDEEVKETLGALRQAGVDIITLGQYLQPSPAHLPVESYISPERFEDWKRFGIELGFKVFESGPMVRSSYHAEEQSLRFSSEL
jgi:lipoic acid synthetase